METSIIWNLAFWTSGDDQPCYDDCNATTIETNGCWWIFMLVRMMDCCDAGERSTWLVHNIVDRSVAHCGWWRGGVRVHSDTCTLGNTNTQRFIYPAILLVLNNSVILSALTTTNDLIMLIWARNSQRYVYVCVCQQDWQEPTGLQHRNADLEFHILILKALGNMHTTALKHTHTHTRNTHSLLKEPSGS